MPVNGTDQEGLALANSLQNGQLVFNRMGRYVGRLGKDAAAGDVHRFRTNGRRVEALISELTPDSKNRKKLLKLLRKLRKKAGRLRDLDVQIAFLENLRIPDRQNQRTQLLDELKAERLKRARKLSKAFNADSVRELGKRLRRERYELKLEGVNPLQLAFDRLPNPSATDLNEKAMHAFRIEAKRARYLAEIAKTADASHFVEELKRAQDAIGEWHDVLKLKQRASRLFGGLHDSPLAAALENICRARFRRARSVVAEALVNLSQQKRALPAKRSGRAAVHTDSTAPHAAAVA